MLVESFILTAFFGLRKFSTLYFSSGNCLYLGGVFFVGFVFVFFIYVETIGFDPHSKEKTQLSRLKINFRRVAHGARGQRACAHVHRAQSLSTCRAASGPSLHPDLVLVLLQGHTVSVTAVF